MRVARQAVYESKTVDICKCWRGRPAQLRNCCLDRNRQRARRTRRVLPKGSHLGSAASVTCRYATIAQNTPFEEHLVQVWRWRHCNRALRAAPLAETQEPRASPSNLFAATFAAVHTAKCAYDSAGRPGRGAGMVAPRKP